jgi:hypothetical protein
MMATLRKERVMITRGDAEWSVYQGLRSLPRRSYLVTMWILCGELQTMYAPWTGNDAAALMTPTMDLVREAAMSGESAELSRRGLDLARAWRPVYAAADAFGSRTSGGLLRKSTSPAPWGRRWPGSNTSLARYPGT